jgi:hypothetical protein
LIGVSTQHSGLGRQLGVDPASVEADVQQRLGNISK